MIVVADTSPLNYLILIEEIDLLFALFGHVLLPQAVFQELQHPKTSPKVSEWVAHHPPWVQVLTPNPATNDELIRLDPGEREAIQLALELGINTVLLDEADGRRLAKKFHLEVRGTLGILERGARLGLLDFRMALSKLERTNFRLSPAVRNAFLKRSP